MISQFLKTLHCGQLGSEKDPSVNYWNQSIRVAYYFSPNSMIVLKKIPKWNGKPDGRSVLFTYEL